MHNYNSDLSLFVAVCGGVDSDGVCCSAVELMGPGLDCIVALVRHN